MGKCTNCGGPIDDKGKCRVCGVDNFKINLSEDGCQVLTKIPDEVAFMQTKYFDRKAENLNALNYNLDEHCTDCKEYDKENHRCPRWNRVIRTTMNDEINAELDSIVNELNENPPVTISAVIELIKRHKRGEW